MLKSGKLKLALIASALLSAGFGSQPAASTGIQSEHDYCKPI